MPKKSMVIFNSAHSGYRRAGLVFNKGDNIVENLSEAQIQSIEDDKRLVLQKPDPSKSTAQKELVAGTDGIRKSVEDDKALALVINSLAVDGLLELTKSGKPEVAQLEAVTEAPVSAKQRDNAWDWYSANIVAGEASTNEGNA